MLTSNGLTSGADGGMFPVGAASYNQSGVLSGLTYSVRSWHSSESKFAFVSVDLKGSAIADIDLDLPLLPYALDIVGTSSQSLFLTAWEYTEGLPISPEGLRGALIISKDGSVKLKISNGSTMTDGSSETKLFRIQ